jgi:D-threonate/D-erythronate kinase
MTALRLLADDLTGALDSAAGFVPLTGPVATAWRRDANAAAIDTGTRDLPEAEARTAIARYAPLLESGEPAFKKIDSLLRGHVALELAACMRSFDHCVLAPAFPFQGRITRNGRQLVRTDDGWRATGVDLAASLHARGVTAHLCDAATDADLDAIVAQGRALAGRVLWCGSGGLAGALAGRRPVPCPDLPRPILALIGSDHPVTAAQLAAVPELHGTAAFTAALPAGTPRDIACRIITARFVTLLNAIPRPGTLFVTGGETLRALCDALGVTHLDVDGEIEPGVPTSILRGGAWDGQRLVSKSGAFGDAGFLRRLL